MITALTEGAGRIVARPADSRRLHEARTDAGALELAVGLAIFVDARPARI